MAKTPKQETSGKPWDFVDHPAAEAEFDGLPPDVQTRLFDRLSAAAVTGFNLLRAPLVRPVPGLTGVVEIRESGEGGEAAAFYVSRPTRRAVLVGYQHPATAELPRRTLAKLGRRAAEAR
jgi:hypothetical protein